MEARNWLGSAARPGVDDGFSTNAAIFSGLSASVSITPNWSAMCSGWRTAATVALAPLATCCSTIWEKSIR